MKNINVPYVLLIILLAVTIVSFKAVHNGILVQELEDIQQKLTSEKNQTVGLLQAMPEESYPYRPNDEVAHFGNQASDLLVEIGKTIYNLSDEPHDFQVDPFAVDSKERLIAKVSAGYEEIARHLNVKEVKPADLLAVDKFLVINARKKGQLQLYLDMKGIKFASELAN